MNKTRVTVIDDDASVLRSLERLLNVAGYETSSFSSVESFLASGAGPATNCLILDLILPGMCGLEAIGLLKRDFPTMKIIVVSGCGRAKNREVLEAARRLGADAYFSKPLEGAELLATARLLLQRQEEASRAREALK
jgi:FixJ family two-component response regulator